MPFPHILVIMVWAFSSSYIHCSLNSASSGTSDDGFSLTLHLATTCIGMIN